MRYLGNTPEQEQQMLGTLGRDGAAHRGGDRRLCRGAGPRRGVACRVSFVLSRARIAKGPRVARRWGAPAARSAPRGGRKQE